MLTGLTGWGVAVGMIVVVWLVLYIRKGPVEALGAAMVLSFAFPVWLKLEVAGVPLNVRSTIAAITMIGYAVHPRGKIISPLTLLDFCVGFMVCSQIVSDVTVDGLSVGLPFAAYGEWGFRMWRGDTRFATARIYAGSQSGWRVFVGLVRDVVD